MNVAADSLLGLGLVEMEPAVAAYGGYLEVSDMQGFRISRLGARFVEALRGPGDEG